MFEMGKIKQKLTTFVMYTILYTITPQAQHELMMYVGSVSHFNSGGNIDLQLLLAKVTQLTHL